MENNQRGVKEMTCMCERNERIAKEIPDRINPCDSMNWASRLGPGVWKVNPVHPHPDGTWWFYDEIQVDEYGPYVSEAEADSKIKEYAQQL